MLSWEPPVHTRHTGTVPLVEEQGYTTGLYFNKCPVQKKLQTAICLPSGLLKLQSYKHFIHVSEPLDPYNAMRRYPPNLHRKTNKLRT